MVLEPGSDTMVGHGPTPHQAIHGDSSLMAGNGGLLIQNVGPRDYYPSPAPSTETESSGSVIPQPQQPRHAHIDRGPDGEQLMEISGRHPEYKH